MAGGSPARTVGRLTAGLGAFGLGCLAWGHFVELTNFQLRRFTAPVLAPDSPPLRLLHISDMHLLPGQRRKQRWISRLAGLEPDVVISTGDHISAPESLHFLEGTLGRLFDAPGAFVFGSNDYAEPRFANPTDYVVKGPSSSSLGDRNMLPTEQVRELLIERGWVDLNNASARLEVGDLRVDLRGTDDPHIRRDDYAAVSGEVDPEADVTIGVTHAPYARVLDAMTADGVDLMLSGHTHGGQVCLPFLGALVTNCDLPRHQAKGLSRHTAAGRTASLHVSAGLGTSPFAPYRFFCAPEATLLTLVPRTG